MGEQLGPGPTGFAAERWNGSRCGTLALEAEALGVINRAVARFMAAPDADRPAAMARLLVIAGCCRPADAMVSKLCTLEQCRPAQEDISLGLRLAEPVLVRMAHADPPPRVVEGVLALWVHEAAGAQRLFHPSVYERVAARDAGSVFAEQPALEHAVFSADMRASVRDAPRMAHLAFHGTMVIVAGHVLTRPTDVDAAHALALHACKAAEAAHEIATAAAAATAAGGAADARQRATVAEAQAWAEEALKAAALRVEAARAARRGEGAGAPPGGPAGAAHGDDVSQDSECMTFSDSSAEAEYMAAMAAGSSDGDEDSEGMPDEMAGLAEAEYLSETEYMHAMADYGWYDDGYDGYSDQWCPDLDSMDDDLANELDGEPTGAMLTDGRTTCARRHCCLSSSL